MSSTWNQITFRWGWRQWPQDKWPPGLRRSRHQPKDLPPCPPWPQLNLTSRPHTAILKGQVFLTKRLFWNNTATTCVYLSLYINAMSNEWHLKISIGSELGEKAGIGREYAAAQLHRIPFLFFFTLDFFSSLHRISFLLYSIFTLVSHNIDFFSSFTVFPHLYSITSDFFSSLQYFHTYIA